MTHRTIKWPPEGEEAGHGLTKEDVAFTPHKPYPTKVPEVMIRPRVSDLLEDAMNVAQSQLNVYKKGGEMSPGEVNAFAKLVAAIMQMAREEREQMKASNPEEMSQEDLWALIRDAKTAGLLPEDL
jgi:hypothetical protein